MKVTIYSDGSSRGNPGPGGYGTVIHFYDSKNVLHEKEISCGYRHTTNNRMELMGVIAGLESLTCPCEVTVVTDSKYVVDAFNQHWIDGWIKRNWRTSNNTEVKNPDLWKRLLNAKSKHQVTFKWIKGHNAHPQNERCDQLAVAAALSGNLQEDKI